MPTTPKAIPTQRGCGAARTAGGAYAECGFGPGGEPLEHFLSCPPVVIDPPALGLTPIGVKLIERAGVWHILDWVGSQHYPNVADFIEEVRRFGLSRRLAKTLDFAKLTPDSRILLVHARAAVTHFGQYADHWLGVKYNRCPKNMGAHNLPDAPDLCAGFYWEDVEGGSVVTPPSPGAVARDGGRAGDGGRVILRAMPAFTYLAAQRPAHITPHYQPAIFASFPVHRIAVIRGQHGEHESTFAQASRASLPIELEDE